MPRQRKRRGRRPTARLARNFWREVLVSTISGVVAGVLIELISRIIDW